MHDAVTITLILLIVALLRRSLLTPPDVTRDVRGVYENDGTTALVPIPVKAQSPHRAGRNDRNREGL
ncbi:conserved protein of unknown function [Pseudodesulfovibrio profundus]|uniref:Uncharacterized protein n=1 Tax=Pseudodesulfovibrio profundus TaxID=57320 RepID=A0A2C8F9D9_9BACT|nr:conserved protein of unknown function [Pseudodesulfovibrio profundus]